MKNIRAALDDFWNGFYDRSTEQPVPIPVYMSEYAMTADAQGKPQSPEFPYITYDIALSSFGASTALAGRIWTWSTSWGLVDDVLEQAAERIPMGGAWLDMGKGGGMILRQANPFTAYQDQDKRFSPSHPSSSPMLKAGAITVNVKCFIP